MFIKSATLSTELSTIIPQRSQIFVIIVHFGDPRPTDQLVKMLLGGTIIPRVIVVDHGDDLYVYADSRVHSMRPGVNKGYFAGLREGVAAAASLGATDSDLFVLCNNDLAVADHSIESIQTWWREHGGSGMIAGPFMGRLSLVTGRASVVPGQATSSALSVPYIHGACIVAQYGTVRDLPFTGLFLYWEDVAYSLMVTTIRHIPNLDIHHDDSPDPLSPDKLYYLVRNGAWVMERYTPIPWPLYWFMINRVRLLYHRLMNKQHSSIVIQALRDSWTMNLN